MKKKIGTYKRIIIFTLVCSLLSLYIVYEQATQADAISLDIHMERHHNLINGKSEFYNPWQYRIFSAFSVELFSKSLRNFQIDPIISHLIFRIILAMSIFIAFWKYLGALSINNDMLRYTGVIILSYSMSNSTFQSDLSFNTYFDVLFYLIAGYLVLKNRILWIVPLTFLAVLNRETSGFICLIPVIWKSNFKPFWIDRSSLTVSLISLFVFIVVFTSIRYYYGYQEAVGIHGMRNPTEYLFFNFGFKRIYPLLIGTFSIIPIIFLMNFRTLPLFIEKMFWLIVPFWIIIHLTMSTAMETRLFLVPITFVFIPGFLIILRENLLKDKLKYSTKTSGL